MKNTLLLSLAALGLSGCLTGTTTSAPNTSATEATQEDPTAKAPSESAQERVNHEPQQPSAPQQPDLPAAVEGPVQAAQQWPASDWDRVALGGMWTDQDGTTIAVGQAGLVVTGDAELGWTPEIVEAEVDWLDVHGADGLQVAVGKDGAIAERTAAGWTRVDSPTTAQLNAVWVDPSGERAVAAGDEGTLLSRNAEGQWTIEPGMGASRFVDVAAADGEWVAVASDGTIARDHGQGWTTESAEAGGGLAAVVHHAGDWLLVSGWGDLLVPAEDGWQITAASAPWTIHNATVIDDRVFVVGAWEWLGVWENGEWQTLFEGHCKASFSAVGPAQSGALITAGSYGLMHHDE